MAEALPSQVSTFKVVGRLVRGVADADDAGQQSGVIPIVGAVITFTPSLSPPVYIVTSATPPMIVHQETIEATTDADGYLITKNDASLGVFLVNGQDTDITPYGWTWTIRIVVGGNFPVKTQTIAGGANIEVDLATVVSVPENIGEELVQWVSTLNQVNAARDAVLAAKASLDASINGIVVTEDSLSPGFAKITQSFGDFNVIESVTNPGFADIAID